MLFFRMTQHARSPAANPPNGHPLKPLLVGGWPTLPLWKMMDFVSWDDDIPQYMEK